MAKLVGNFEFIGSLGGVTAYRMKGCDRIVLRKTTGPSKQRIKTDPSYERTRENAQEFGGVAKAAKHLRQALSWLERVADYNFQPALNKVTKAIQKLDIDSDRGERNILYSQHHEMLKGFNLNKYHLFDSIVRKPVTCTIDRATGSATVTIPSLQLGINLNLPWPMPRFRFVATLGVCGDMLFNGTEYDEHRMDDPQTEIEETDWQPADQPYAGETITLQIKDPGILHDDSSLVVTIGIVFDMTHRTYGNDRLSSLRPTGSAKILDLANPLPVAERTLKPTLQLPVTIRVPEPAELQQSEDMLELLQQRQQARIVEGYEIQSGETDAASASPTFSAAINVDNSQLGRVVRALIVSFPDDEITCEVQAGDEAPVTTGRAPKRKLIKTLKQYPFELGYDTSLSYGLSVQNKDGLVKLWVTGCKYIRYQGVDQEKFEKLMWSLDIRKVQHLEFVDAYPMVTLPVTQFVPGAKDAKTVIRELMEALKE